MDFCLAILNNNDTFSTVRHKCTEYGVLLGVFLLTVQAEQGAVVEVVDDPVELVTERTPFLQRKPQEVRDTYFAQFTQTPK